jgi:hypothetical protein
MSDEKVNPDDGDNLLTADQVLQGGDDPFKRVELRSATVRGKPGVVWMKRPSASAVLQFTAMDQAQRADRLPHLIADSVVDSSGRAMFTDPKKVRNMDVRVFQELQVLVTEMMGIDTEEIVKNLPKTPDSELSTN